jgi:hypothetical protein
MSSISGLGQLVKKPVGGIVGGKGKARATHDDSGGEQGEGDADNGRGAVDSEGEGARHDDDDSEEDAVAVGLSQNPELLEKYKAQLKNLQALRISKADVQKRLGALEAEKAAQIGGVGGRLNQSEGERAIARKNQQAWDAACWFLAALMFDFIKPSPIFIATGEALQTGLIIIVGDKIHVNDESARALTDFSAPPCFTSLRAPPRNQRHNEPSTYDTKRNMTGVAAGMVLYVGAVQAIADSGARDGQEARAKNLISLHSLSTDISAFVAIRVPGEVDADEPMVQMFEEALAQDWRTFVKKVSQYGARVKEANPAMPPCVDGVLDVEMDTASPQLIFPTVRGLFVPGGMMEQYITIQQLTRAKPAATAPAAATAGAARSKQGSRGAMVPRGQGGGRANDRQQLYGGARVMGAQRRPTREEEDRRELCKYSRAACPYRNNKGGCKYSHRN